MLTLFADGAESLWDELLPEEVRVLPDDLARLDELLSDPEQLVPIAIRWQRELAEASRFADRGRPSLAIETYVRLMVLKHRCGWGYETLMREVSDSIHLRRFCRLGLTERVPDESTVRKLTRRLGPEVVHQLSRELIQKARREKRFRPRAARIDSTVVEADIRYPTDSGLAADGVKALAREGRKLAAKLGAKRTAVRDRSRAAGRRVRGITRTMRHRSGQAKEEVLKLTKQTGELLAKSVNEARALAQQARRRARGRGAQAKLTSCAQARAARRPLRESHRADQTADQGREDHRPADLAVGPRCPADPQAQAQPAQPVRLRRSALRDHRQHQAGRARVHPAACQPDRQSGRGHAAAGHRDRAAEPRDQAAGGDGRRRVQRDPHEQRAAGHRRRGPHHRPPGTRLPTHPPPPTALPRRSGRTSQPPQTRLRPAPQPPQRRRRPPDLGRMGRLHLQRRHLHHPPVKKQPLNPRRNGRGPRGKQPKG